LRSGKAVGLIQQAQPPLDLEEVILVDVEVVRFLGMWEAKGVELSHCSPYIREWVFREQATRKKAKCGVGYEQRKHGSFR
jgi:hypothetical protein